MEAPERGQVAHVLPRSTLGCGDSVRPAGVRMGRHPRLSPPPVPEAHARVRIEHAGRPEMEVAGGGHDGGRQNINSR